MHFLNIQISQIVKTVTKSYNIPVSFKVKDQSHHDNFFVKYPLYNYLNPSTLSAFYIRIVRVLTLYVVIRWADMSAYIRFPMFVYRRVGICIKYKSRYTLNLHHIATEDETKQALSKSLFVGEKMCKPLASCLREVVM